MPNRWTGCLSHTRWGSLFNNELSPRTPPSIFGRLTTIKPNRRRRLGASLRSHPTPSEPSDTLERLDDHHANRRRRSCHHAQPSATVGREPAVTPYTLRAQRHSGTSARPSCPTVGDGSVIMPNRWRGFQPSATVGREPAARPQRSGPSPWSCCHVGTSVQIGQGFYHECVIECPTVSFKHQRSGPSPWSCCSSTNSCPSRRPRPSRSRSACSR